jgi:hypothetical protein
MVLVTQIGAPYSQLLRLIRTVVNGESILYGAIMMLNKYIEKKGGAVPNAFLELVAMILPSVSRLWGLGMVISENYLLE